MEKNKEYSGFISGIHIDDYYIRLDKADCKISKLIADLEYHMSEIRNHQKLIIKTRIEIIKENARVLYEKDCNEA